MLKKVNNFLNIIIGAFIGVFIGHGGYVFWDYKTHPELYADLQNFATPDMTKERYETLTDKEKVEWLGIAECSVQDAIQKFISKLDSIGVVYQYSDDMLDEFMRLEAVAEKLQQEQKMEEEIPMGGKLFKEGKKSR